MRILSERYELLEPLGRSGTGTVYRAVDRELDQIVAVRVSPAEMPRGEDSRFRRAVRAAAKL